MKDKNDKLDLIEIKNCTAEKTTLRNLNVKPLALRKYLWNKNLTKKFCPEYIKISYNSIRSQIANNKMDKSF